MSEATGAARGRLRYAAVNAALLAAIAVGGAAGVAVLGRMGREYVRETDVRASVTVNLDRFRQGDAIPAQQALERILRIHPEYRNAVTEMAGPDLLAMPRAYRAAVTAPAPAAEDDVLAAVRRLLLAGDIDGADHALAALDERGALPREGRLWRARIALDRGAVDAARSDFDGYWRGRSGERAEALDSVRALGADPARTDETLQTLLWLGLWDECFDTADRAAPSPMAWTVRGIALESAGRREEALKAYRSALEAQPGNRLAALRAAALEGA